MKRVIILGASGNIGQQTIEIIRENPDDFTIVAVSVGNNIDYLKQLVTEFPSIVSVFSLSSFPNSAKNSFSGENGLLSLLDSVSYDICVNALVGTSGFLPSVKVLESNHTLCLANKESLVVGGFILNDLLDRGLGKLIPIDSEHCGVLKTLRGREKNEIKQVILTTSGGALRKIPHSRLKDIKAFDALKHPTWNMGAKITIDSATMMNKAFEIIEAYYLFRVEPEQILVVQHEQSKVHALIQLADNSLIAEISNPDMKNSIRFALYDNGYRSSESVDPLSILNRLDFKDISFSRYPLLKLSYQILKRDLLLAVVFNAVNDVLVDLFLHDKITLHDHEKIMKEAVHHFEKEIQKRHFSKNVSTVLYLMEASKNYLRRYWQIGE